MATICAKWLNFCLAIVSLEYDQTNEAAFVAQFEALLRYLDRQQWADTNAIAWVGFSRGANRMLHFALQHPGQQSQLLVLLSCAGLSSYPIPRPQTPICIVPVLLVHGEQDEVFHWQIQTGWLQFLQTNGLSVELKFIPGIPHGMEPERGVIFRNIGEYFPDASGWQGYLAKLSFHCPMADKRPKTMVILAAGSSMDYRLVCVGVALQNRLT